MTAITPSWPLGLPTRSTYWVSVLLRTRRTYGLTKNLQDQGDNLTLRNAHENGGRFTVAPYCEVPDHELYRAKNCQGCRAEFLETGVWPSGSQHHQATHTPAGPDVQSLAAHDIPEEEL